MLLGALHDKHRVSKRLALLSLSDIQRLHITPLRRELIIAADDPYMAAIIRLPPYRDRLCREASVAEPLLCVWFFW